MMKSLDLIEQEQREREAGAVAAPVGQEGEQAAQQATTQPEANGGSGRLFTQEEVNRIVSERLARERAKQPPDQALQELEAKVKRMEMREFLVGRYGDEPNIFAWADQVLDMLRPESVDDLDSRLNAAETVSAFEAPHTIHVSGKGESVQSKITDRKLRSIFGL